SYVLIDIARRFYSEGKIDESKFVIKSALRMSPEDGRVHFAAMPFADGEQGGSFVSYLYRGVALLARYPSVFLPFFANILLASLAALTLAFIVTCVVQLSLHHRIVHKVLF